MTESVRHDVAEADTITAYREPLVGFADANDPRFPELRRVANANHMMPAHLLPGARSVVAFFVPFDQTVVQANARDRKAVAREWALAYVETNELISRATDHLVDLLAQHGVRAAAEPPTGNFDPVTLISRWSHKSVAMIAGLGSFGLHHMLITDAGCAGRFGSVVTDVELSSTSTGHRERCLFFYDGSCRACVAHCPIGALSETGSIDRQSCRSRCLGVGEAFKHLGPTEVCGKCVIGPCSLKSPV
ncbi:MAG: epoxyqueuosine reductase [Anaerolineae bacterium]